MSTKKAADIKVGGGALVADLPSEILVAILTSGFLLYDDLIRLSWCDKKLHDAIPVMSIEDGIFAVGMRRAKDFHDSKKQIIKSSTGTPTDDGLKFMQALTAAEEFFTTTGGLSWDQALARAKSVIGSKSPFEPELDLDFSPYEEERYPIYDGEVTLCFGFIADWEQLWNGIYPGRRWYSDERLMSQPLSEPPYEGEDRYTEIDTSHDELSSNIWMGCELDYDDPRKDAKIRPPGLKAWKGPFLKYHVPTAIADHAKRIDGIDANIMNIMKGISVHYTGGAEGGPAVVVGIRIGQKMPAEYFDIFKATGQRLFNAGSDVQDGNTTYTERFGYDIVDASDEYAATTMGWDVDSFPFEKMTETMAHPVAALAQNLRTEKQIRVSGIGYYFICNSW
jgi:hypothetical protein